MRRPRTPAMNSASLRMLFITERARNARSIWSMSSPGSSWPVSGLTARALDPLDRRRPQLASVELVDGREQQPRVVGEVLRGVRPAGVDDRGEIVGAEVLLDEAARGGLHARRPREVGVHVVEHDQIDAALEMLVGLHVRLDRLAGEQRPLGALDRNVDEREGRDLLRLAVLEAPRSHSP